MSHVVKGEMPGACWIWTGAIGDDGYGRFWMHDDATGEDKMLRPHRYALLRVLDLDPAEVAHLHALHRCDNPLCVRATAGGDTHIVLGDHGENMAERFERGRSNFQATRYDPQARATRAANARALRAWTVEHGYSQAKVDELMKYVDPEQGALF